MEVKIMKFCDILNNNESENLLKEWLEFREEDLCHIEEEDKKYMINFDDYSEKILKNVTNESYNYVSKKLEFMYDDFNDYCTHWNNKYYMNGFSDAIKLIISGLK